MATPIQYVPQYVPMDIGTMSNILDRKQARYNEAYAAPLAFEDYFSQIPVTPENIPGKNAILGKFQNRIQEVVDRYGGDYGAASKDIAREITRERSNPFYQLAPQHYQRSEEARKLGLELGPYALQKKQLPSTFVNEKGEIVADNFNYDIQDMRSFDPQTTQLFKEHATSYTRDINRPRTGGYREIGTQYGYKDSNEANAWLNSSEGQNMLSNIYSQYGVNPGENQQLDSHIRSIALGNLVGQRDTQIVRDEKDTLSGKDFETMLPKLNDARLEIYEDPKKGYKAVARGIGMQRDVKKGVNILAMGESALNSKLNQEVKNYSTGNNRTWVFGTSGGSEDEIGSEFKKGRFTTNSVEIPEGRVQGAYKFYEIQEAVPIGTSALENFDPIKAPEEYNYNSLVTVGEEKENVSSIGAVSNDKNFTAPHRDSDGNIVVYTNKGNKKEMKYIVSPVNAKVITTTDGRKVVQEMGRIESKEFFGKDAGVDMVDYDFSNDGKVNIYNVDISDESFKTLQNRVLLKTNISDPSLAQNYILTFRKALLGKSLSEDEQVIFKEYLDRINDEEDIAAPKFGNNNRGTL